MKKSTILHLRIPFSFFLLPVFLFGAAVAPNYDWTSFALVFFILHFLLYPASNGYNSYFDKDEESIGGLKVPPKVTRELYWVSWSFDLLALLLGLFISFKFSCMLFVYGLVSKAYSHPAIRLKRHAITGWLAAGIFQGYFTVLMVVLGLSDGNHLVLYDTRVQLAGILSSLLLFGSYPMTQVYQHGEDARRGDRTISLKLGILGTFHFTAFCFFLSTAVFFWFFYTYYSLSTGIYFLFSLLPVLGYFSYWYQKVRQDLTQADFEHTMRLNLLSSLCLNVFFLWMFLS